MKSRSGGQKVSHRTFFFKCVLNSLVVQGTPCDNTWEGRWLESVSLNVSLFNASSFILSSEWLCASILSKNES